MRNQGWHRAAPMLALAALMTAMPSLSQAQRARPSAAALIAGAKATPLAKFEVKDELRELTIEPWLNERVGRKGRIAWRTTSCHARAGDRVVVRSPVCVEAVIRYANGVTLTVGIGFDEKAPRPEQNPNAMWGSIAVRGRGCEFLRHPDRIDGALAAMDDLVKAGRCQ